MNWVEFAGVTLGYGRQTVLSGLTFGLPQGAAVGVAGPNGSGKTTLLKAVLGLLPPLAGTIRPAAEVIGNVGYVPQRGALDETFPFTLEEIVEMGTFGKLQPWQAPGEPERAAIVQALADVGLEPLARRPFRDLSGGQKQRGLLARALVSSPRLLVLDEPTHGLDLAQAQLLLQLLDRLRLENGLSLVIVSHTLAELLHHTQHLLLLHDGALAYAGPGDGLTDALLSRIYGIPVTRPVELRPVESHRVGAL